jgi:hypothetical protein
VDAFAAELVDALRLTHEHDLEFLTIRVIVDVVSDASVDHIVLNGDIDCNTRL